MLTNLAMDAEVIFSKQTGSYRWTGELCCAPLGAETVPGFEMSLCAHCQQLEYKKNQVSHCVHRRAD